MAGGSSRNSRALELPGSGLGGVNKCFSDQGVPGEGSPGQEGGALESMEGSSLPM